jgi:hypothetical protein
MSNYSYIIDRIDKFIEKQKVHMTEEEAESIGIHVPKVRKTKKDSHEKIPKQPADSFKDKKKIDTSGKVINTIGQQLTPLGPYQTIQDVSHDVNTARNASNFVRNINNSKVKI